MTALHALRRLSTIASALGHQEERVPDDVSTRGDVDACSRASRALHLDKGVAGAGRPPSLLAVATFHVNSLSLSLDITDKSGSAAPPVIHLQLASQEN